MTDTHKLSSYPKIYNLGHRAIDLLFDGSVLVEEKVDGSQFSFGVVDGELRCRSKGAAIEVEAPPKLFARAVATARALKSQLHPGWIYRGEALDKPKHNALAYDRVPKGNVIIWDIEAVEGTQQYLTYPEKCRVASALGLEVVPSLGEGRFTDPAAELQPLLEHMSILGGQKIEGVVIKNYEQFGKDGKILTGKMVSERFREVHKKSWKEQNPAGRDIVTNLCQRYRSESRWNKAIQHLRDRDELHGDPRDIGPLMKEVYQDVEEECREEIAAALYTWARKDILRGATRGLPQWYKRQLAERQRGCPDA